MSGKNISVLVLLLLSAAVISGGYFVYQYIKGEQAEQIHFDREETELVVVNTTGSKLSLFKSGENLREPAAALEFNGESIWLGKGNYFLQAELDGRNTFYPVPVHGYRSGNEDDGSFSITIRPTLGDPPVLMDNYRMAYVPSGYFLFGNRLNPNEPHLVWTPAFFIGQFEVTNAEFRQFLAASDGYADQENWTDAGREWKARSRGESSAKLSPGGAEFRRFGQDDQPVTQVTWFEAAAYCRWLTRKIGGGRWLYSLPNEAEWEKAARGPDNFEYPMGRILGDAEVSLYNWKKNPIAEVTVIGFAETLQRFQPDRYGIYHLGGNAAEWTQGLSWQFNRDKPYAADDGRNRDDAPGARVVRGGSWYSASTALLYIPYRETFQPEVSHNDLGFRIVVRSLMH